jgi:hypothetical protein
VLNGQWLDRLRCWQQERLAPSGAQDFGADQVGEDWPAFALLGENGLAQGFVWIKAANCRSGLDRHRLAADTGLADGAAVAGVAIAGMAHTGLPLLAATP